MDFDGRNYKNMENCHILHITGENKRYIFDPKTKNKGLWSCLIQGCRN